MHGKQQYYTIARLLFTIVAAALLVGLWYGDGSTTSLPSMVAGAHRIAAQGPGLQRAGIDSPTSSPSVARGMGKEEVRTVWGDPKATRKIRTCFGWQEEWVYRGDPKRFGVSERVLLFDEGDVLTEIK